LVVQVVAGHAQAQVAVLSTLGDVQVVVGSQTQVQVVGSWI